MHHFWKVVQLSHDSVIIEEWRSRTRKEKGESLSYYSCKSIKEFIAEAWSEYRNNPNCRPLAKKIGERAKELFKANVGGDK